MEWYLKVVRDNYANFSGRARRSEYWYFTLFNLIIVILLALLTALDEIFVYLYLAYLLGIIIPTLAVAVRRLHDTGRSGWTMFLAFVPFGGFILLIFNCMEGDRHSNRYGKDPKNPYGDDLDEIGRQVY